MAAMEVKAVAAAKVATGAIRARSISSMKSTLPVAPTNTSCRRARAVLVVRAETADREVLAATAGVTAGFSVVPDKPEGRGKVVLTGAPDSRGKRDQRLLRMI
jgi:hypothetical protein